MPSSRTLSIQWNDLPQQVNIVLCFDGPARDASAIPIAWKAINCRPGNGMATITYSGRLAFLSGGLVNGNIVNVDVYTEAPPGTLVSLHSCDGNLMWSEPTRHSEYGKMIKASNVSGARQNIGLGLVQAYTTDAVLLWKDVGNHMTAAVNFDPTMSAYISSDYQEGQLMDPIPENSILTQNLNALDRQTQFELSVAPDGNFQLTRV